MAMLRFSYMAVPVGKVPSTGMAETGRLSPRPSMIGPREFLTVSGVPFHWPIVISIALSALAGTVTS